MVFSKKNYKNGMVILIFLLCVVAMVHSQDYNTVGFTESFFVDKFGDPTTRMYLSKEIEGRFSNSATTNSKLIVRILLADYEFGISLYEYGSSRVKSKDTYVISFKTKSGNINEVTAKGVPELGRISLYQLPGDMNINEVFDGVSLTKFYIYEEDREITNYSFSLILPTIEYLKSKLGDNIRWIK